MAKDAGWIKLHRSSFDNQLYFSEPFTKWQAWQDLLLLVNHKEGVLYKRGIQVKVPRGCTGYGTEELAKRWKWSRGKCERFFQFLEGQTVKQIVRQKTNITTLISIVNYELYHSDDKANGTENGQQTVKQTDTNNNDKNNTVNTLVKKGQEKNQKNETEFNSPAINNNLSWEQLFANRVRNRTKDEVDLNR